MYNKYFDNFKKSGKIKDYLLYKEELAKEMKESKDEEKGRDHTKLDNLSRKQ